MSRHRRPSRWLSGWLIVALLFMQFATAAYACPRESVPPVAHAPACEGHAAQDMDPMQPQLCKAHCAPDTQVVGGEPAATPAAAPLLLAVLDWRTTEVLPAWRAEGHRGAPMGAPPPSSPPIYLTLHALRN